MSDLLELSRRVIDGETSGPTSRMSLELSEVAEGLAVIESFSNVVLADTGDGLVMCDTSLVAFAEKVIEQMEAWRPGAVSRIIYTHGHVDHVGGAQAVCERAATRGEPRPEILSHEDVPLRFDRYRRTEGYNGWINARQFGGTGLTGAQSRRQDAPPLFPTNFVEPTWTYRDRLSVAAGDEVLELRHARGETDDHTWVWLGRHRAVAIGDLFIWCFPNAGNPQKVQRYPLDWARALREICAEAPDLLLPAHGLPVAGAERIGRVLGDVAGALESLVEQTLGAMNAGLDLDSVLAEVSLDEDLLELPWLAPLYDEPEFVVRNIWRLYGGWYDGNPARLKPAPDAARAAELARLCGGTEPMVARALELAEGDDLSLRLACHLVSDAVAAAPDDPGALAAHVAIYRRRREHETSLMAKGIFGHAAVTSEQQLDEPAG